MAHPWNCLLVALVALHFLPQHPSSICSFNPVQSRPVLSCPVSSLQLLVVHSQSFNAISNGHLFPSIPSYSRFDSIRLNHFRPIVPPKTSSAALLRFSSSPTSAVSRSSFPSISFIRSLHWPRLLSSSPPKRLSDAKHGLATTERRVSRGNAGAHPTGAPRSRRLEGPYQEKEG